jgi:hypothetical protein
MQKVRDNPELQMDPLAFFKAFGARSTPSTSRVRQQKKDLPTKASKRKRESNEGSGRAYIWTARPEILQESDDAEPSKVQPLSLPPPDKKTDGSEIA